MLSENKIKLGSDETLVERELKLFPFI